MHLLGLLIMQNALKPETSPVMHQLQAAKIRSVMVTGMSVSGFSWKCCHRKYLFHHFLNV